MLILLPLGGALQAAGASPEPTQTRGTPIADQSNSSSASSATPTPFSIFWITDTQYLSETNEPLFAKTTSWIADHYSAYGGRMVVHTGDIVENASASGDWSNANSAMSVLLSDGIPYTWNAGNHDILGYGSPNWIGSKFAAFNPSVVGKEVNATGYSSWVGSTDNGMDTAVTFTADGMAFMIINVEYDANATVLGWVSSILSDPLYQSAHVIIATHAYIDPDGNVAGPDAGLYNFTTALTALMDLHPNVFMTMNGHFFTSGGYHGLNPMGEVYNLMFNRQECVDSEGCPPVINNTPDVLKDGSATVTILTFEPSANQISVATYAVDMGSWLNDSADDYVLHPIFPGTPTLTGIRAGSVSFVPASLTYGSLGLFQGLSLRVVNAWNSSQQIVVYATFRLGTSVYVAMGETTLAPGQIGIVFAGDLQTIPSNYYYVSLSAVTTAGVPVADPVQLTVNANWTAGPAG